MGEEMGRVEFVRLHEERLEVGDLKALEGGGPDLGRRCAGLSVSRLPCDIQPVRVCGKEGVNNAVCPPYPGAPHIHTHRYTTAPFTHA